MPKPRNYQTEAIIIQKAKLGDDVITQLGQHPKAKVIALNFNQRNSNVYRVRRVVNSNLDGLMDAIRGRRQLPGKESHKKKTESADAGNGGETMGT